MIIDPAGKQRKNFFDALGRLVRVDEPGWGDALMPLILFRSAEPSVQRLVSTRYCAQYTF